MRLIVTVFLSSFLLANVGDAAAADDVLDCQNKSLADAIKSKPKGQTINFTGTCTGPIVIDADGLALTGVGDAFVDGGGEDAIVVVGAGNVSFSSFHVRNARNGISAVNGAHLTMMGLEVHDNAMSGITLQTGSSAILTNVSTHHNGLHGLDLQTGSAATVGDSLTASNNRVFGINVNGSSITFAKASVSANLNALGIQIATNSNAFINDADTVINVNNNLATGLTVVSGAHMVSFREPSMRPEIPLMVSL